MIAHLLWANIGHLLLGLVLSVVFFRLYSAHDFREITIRLLRNTYEKGDGADLVHSGRHAVRIAFSVLLGVLVAGRIGWITLPAIGAVLGIGYLIFDPTLNKDRGLDWDYSGQGNYWDRFWLKLTKRQQPAERWSAYVETIILLLNIIWFCYLSYAPLHQ